MISKEKFILVGAFLCIGSQALATTRNGRPGERGETPSHAAYQGRHDAVDLTTPLEIQAGEIAPINLDAPLDAPVADIPVEAGQAPIRAQAPSERPKEGELVPFRTRIEEPGLYVLERGATGDDSVGKLLSASLEAEALVAAFLKREGGLAGRRLYATGVEMGSEKAALRRVLDAAAAARVPAEDLKVRVLSVPRPASRGLLRHALDRVLYFLPSMRRDYQRPLLGEVLWGSLTTAVIEAPNAVYLLSALPSPEAWLVLGVHTALVAAYTIFMRAMANWCLRSKGPEAFLKLTLTALPFVLNYSLFGNFTAIMAHWQSAGAAATLARIPAEALGFVATQGVTLVLQTVFYSWIVMRSFRGWAASQKTPEASAAARSWVNVLLMPWLWLNAIFLAQAGLSSNVLGALGPFALTTGHVYLGLLIAAGSLVAWRPSILDATLGWYGRFRLRR